jgi:hypothetical protein
LPPPPDNSPEKTPSKAILHHIEYRAGLNNRRFVNSIAGWIASMAEVFDIVPLDNMNLGRKYGEINRPVPLFVAGEVV